jgi:hypothetical protein
MKTKFIRTSFSDFYGPGQTNIRQYAESKYGGTINPTDQNVHVHDCFFHFCSSSSSGGALYCSSNVYKLLVEQSSFISCRASYGGGGIYFSNQQYGECVMSKICGFNCSLTYSGSSSCWGQFAYISIKNNNITYKNHVNDSSITHSLKNCNDSKYSLRLNFGQILCPSVNITNNVCYCYSALGCQATSSGTCCISYSSFVNNTSNEGYICIWLYGSNSPHYIDTCNILNNNQTSSEFGTIHLYANLFIKDSCILGNNEGKKVFYVSLYKVTISNCTIDDDIFSKTRYYGPVTVNKTIKRTFINGLSHIVTQKCDSYFDSYGTLTVNPCGPCECSRCLISCNNKLPTIDPLRIRQFIFLLTLLPSDPSNDNYFDFDCLFLPICCE